MFKHSSENSPQVASPHSANDQFFSEQPEESFEKGGSAGRFSAAAAAQTPPRVDRVATTLQRTPGSSSRRTAFRSIQRAYGNKFAGKVSDSYREAHTNGRSTPAVIQRIMHNTVKIDIDTLTPKECNEHLGRIARKEKSIVKGNDAEFTYDPTDKDELKKRIETAKGEEAEAKKGLLVAELEKELASLATAPDFQVKPEWDGHNPGQGTMTETYASGNIKADAGTVIARWKTFLGAGPYTQKHPRDGSVAVGRLISADGKRSIRYGDHEKTSSSTLHHFHEETWTYNSVENKVDVANQVRRVPVT